MKAFQCFLFEQIMIFSEMVGKKTTFTSPSYEYKAHFMVSLLFLNFFKNTNTDRMIYIYIYIYINRLKFTQVVIIVKVTYLLYNFYGFQKGIE